MAMMVGLLIVFVVVFLALAAPFLGLTLLGAAIFRTRRAGALYAFRESLVLATGVAAAFGILGWAVVPYMVDPIHTPMKTSTQLLRKKTGESIPSIDTDLLAAGAARLWPAGHLQR